MPLGVVLVVLIVTAAEPEPAAHALEAAARELLGPSATIRLVLAHADPPDAETLRRAGEADGVVELVWSAGHSSAFLHCYVSRDARWVDRSITFGAGDEHGDRGRLLGFAIASMFQRVVGQTEPATDLASTPGSPAREVVVRTGTEPARVELELGASATTGIGGPADAVGAMVAMRLPLAGPLWLRAAVAARVGEIPVASASTRMATGELGLAWRGTSTADFQFGARADLVASWLEIARTLADDSEVESRSRWTWGGAVLLEGGYRFSPSIGGFVGVGTELSLSETDVYVGGRLVDKLPLFRAVGEIGVRAGF